MVSICRRCRRRIFSVEEPRICPTCGSGDHLEHYKTNEEAPRG